MPELAELAARISGDAKPGEQIETFVARRRSTDVRVFSGEIEQLASAESAGIGVRVITEHRQGFAYVGSIDEASAREALAERRDNASFATPDAFVGLADPDGVAPTELALWRESLVSVPTEEKVALAVDLDRRARAGDARIRQVVSTDYGDSLGEMAIATSTGITASSSQTTCYLATDVVAGEGDDTQTGVGYAVGRSLDDIDPEEAANDAILRATRLLGSTKPQSARMSVVFDRRVTATLLAILASTLSGEEAAKNRSLFSGRLGNDVATPSMTLVDDPTNPLAFGAARFDAEGLACRRTTLIDAGRLTNFLYNTYSAALSGTNSTASAVRAGFKSTPSVGARALSLVPGTLDQEEIFTMLGDCLFIQGISGVHSGVNRISGDFSVGAEGIMVRDGAFAEPVREFTIASTIQRMLLYVLAIGSDIEWLPGNAIGLSLAIDDVAMSGR